LTARNTKHEKAIYALKSTNTVTVVSVNRICNMGASQINKLIFVIFLRKSVVARCPFHIAKY